MAGESHADTHEYIDKEILLYLGRSYSLYRVQSDSRGYFSDFSATSICPPSECNNGAICRHECFCPGDYFGTNCKNLNGGFSKWSAYGECSKSCGTGNKTRTRTCNNPSPAGNGSTCSGFYLETTLCNFQSCPIDGGWSSWNDWGPCSVTCGNGTQQRTRNCTDPPPQHGGNDCEYNPVTAAENQNCNTGDCPVFFILINIIFGLYLRKVTLNATFFFLFLVECSDTAGSTHCVCPTRVINMTSAELLEAITALMEELKVDKRQTSMSIRRKTSVKDSRTSAQTIGAVGAVLLAVPFVLIIMADLSTLYQRLATKRERRRTIPKI
ncbi:uncharacterized protein [Argopecten irradians]|uniref:uncharacterized protein n=1 Tax=Argopecten irradians TaxID=31199 RepID=UPI003713B993